MSWGDPAGGRHSRGPRRNPSGSDPDDLKHLGTFDAPAANHDADGIRCVVYVCNWREIWPEPVPDSEIVEYEWTDLDHCYDDVRQAPLLCDRVIPALQQQGLL